MSFTPSMVAPCGLDCSGCPIHLATLEPDPAKQRSLRVDIVRMCIEQYGMNITLQDVTDCDGCSATTGRLFSGCTNCGIRTCAIGKRTASCAFCSEYACEKLRKHFDADPTARTRLESMKPAS